MTFKLKQLDPEAVKTFSETEVGTLLESIDDNLGFLIEGQKTLDKRRGRVERKVDVLTDTTGDIKIELTVVNDKLDLKADRVVVRQLDRRVTALKAK